MASVEDIAVAWVLSLERQAGRDPRDVRRERGARVDVVSLPRLIEVKAFSGSARGEDLWLEPTQVDAALTQPDRFHLYVVEHVSRSPDGMQLHDLTGPRLARLLERRREKHHFEVPWPVADHDAGPRGLQ